MSQDAYEEAPSDDVSENRPVSKTIEELLTELSNLTIRCYPFPPSLRRYLKEVLSRVKRVLRDLEGVETGRMSQDIYFEVVVALRFCILTMESYRNPRLVDIAGDTCNASAVCQVAGENGDLITSIVSTESEYLSKLSFVVPPKLISKPTTIDTVCTKIIESKRRDSNHDDILLI